MFNLPEGDDYLEEIQLYRDLDLQYALDALENLREMPEFHSKSVAINDAIDLVEAALDLINKIIK